MSRLSIIPIFFVLFFLYMFCSILCFSIEDHFGVKFSEIFYFGNEYWRCFSYMLISSIIIICYSFISKKNLEDSPKQNKLVNTSVLAITIVATIHISNILYQYWMGKAGPPELFVIIVNFLGVALYLLWLKLEKTGNNFKTSFLILLVSIAAIISFGFYLSNKYAPINVIRTVNIDSEIQNEVNNLSSILTGISNVYKDTDELIKNVGREQQDPLISGKIKYKKINDSEFSLSYNLLASREDFEHIKEIRRLLHYEMIYGKDHKQGLNTKTFKIKDKK